MVYNDNQCIISGTGDFIDRLIELKKRHEAGIIRHHQHYDHINFIVHSCLLYRQNHPFLHLLDYHYQESSQPSRQARSPASQSSSCSLASRQPQAPSPPSPTTLPSTQVCRRPSSRRLMRSLRLTGGGWTTRPSRTCPTWRRASKRL